MSAEEQRPSGKAGRQGRWLRLVLNGKGGDRPEVREAVERLRREGHRVEVRVTWEGGDAARLTREAIAEGVETVIAGGGDGTLNEVVTAALAGGGPAPCSVALLPLGTGNDFARCCGIPTDNPLAALCVAIDVEARPIDVGRVGDDHFVNLATGGSGTRITTETSEELKKVLGGVAYLLTGLRRFGDIQPQMGRLRAPGHEWEGSFHGLAVGNGRHAGGGILLCPEAVLDDGLLDVVLLPEIPENERLIKLAALLTEGETAFEREAISWQVPWLEVEVPSGLYVNLDGEPIQAERLRFEVVERALPFHLPREAPLR